MEASSTTVNISAPETPTAEPAKHNHTANFGRYVKDCPKCMVQYPNGPEPRQKKAKAAKVASEAPLTREQIMAMLRESAPTVGSTATPAANGDTLAQLVQLMLAKEGKTLRKEEEDMARLEAGKQDMIRIVMESEALKLANQAACGHVKDNGRTAINGQVHNDGKFHPFCQRCFKEFPAYTPSGEQISNGVQI